ncbi:MAG TPA: type II toxin-antitoxin system VapB family antitoxin [Gammaproteobacteria bacterium]|nr:type II toxin-antitoxin system VapB family antitoxin [Gammaproteobacteria bacterium]
MSTARIFKSGNSQAVRLPKEFRFSAKEVEIFRRGEEVVLREKLPQLSELLSTIPPMSADFFADGRHDPPPDEVEPL